MQKNKKTINCNQSTIFTHTEDTMSKKNEGQSISVEAAPVDPVAEAAPTASPALRRGRGRPRKDPNAPATPGKPKVKPTAIGHDFDEAGLYFTTGTYDIFYRDGSKTPAVVLTPGPQTGEALSAALAVLKCWPVLTDETARALARDLNLNPVEAAQVWQYATK